MWIWLITACTPEVEQTAACATYVSCVAATDLARGTSTNTLRFQADGDCWGTEAGAELCDRACSSGLDVHAARFPDQAAACTP